MVLTIQICSGVGFLVGIRSGIHSSPLEEVCVREQPAMEGGAAIGVPIGAGDGSAGGKTAADGKGAGGCSPGEDASGATGVAGDCGVGEGAGGTTGVACGDGVDGACRSADGIDDAGVGGEAMDASIPTDISFISCTMRSNLSEIESRVVSIR